MAEINQTNRAILFEKFTEGENGNRLDFILKQDINRDEKFKETVDKLICHSYEEFLKKFTPVYYDILTEKEADGIGKVPVFDYTSTNNGLPDSDLEPHKLCEQTFFKVIENLYTTKGRTSENNLTFNYDGITQRSYSPDTVMKDVLDTRRELKYHTEEYMRLEATNGSLNEKNIHARAIKKIRRYIMDEYTSSSKFNAIPLVIRQTEIELENRRKNNEDGDLQYENPNMRMDYYLDENGDLKTSYVEIPSQDLLLLETSAENTPDTKICEILSKDFDSGQPVTNASEGSSKFMKDMHLAMFSGSTHSLRTLSDAQLENNLEKYSFMYEKSHENFSKNLLALVEKVINVKAFFDHAGEGSELIIANCTIEELMKDDDSKKRFEEFSKAAGDETSDNRIWLSIIPAVSYKDMEDIDQMASSEAKEEDPFGASTDTGSGDKPVSSTPDSVSFETLLQALNILGQHRIITFFNFKACEETSQALLTKDKVKKYKKEFFSGISDTPESEYAVFCYPNFTLLPKRNTTVRYQAGKTIELSAVYLDASYIACGLVALTQKYEALKEKGFPINKTLCPPVRFDFESSFLLGNDKVALRHVFPTNLNRESLLAWDSELRKEISEDGGFGFCFSCDPAGYIYKGVTRQQQHTYVYCARTLNKRSSTQSDDGEVGEYYYPLFSALTKTYVGNYYNINKNFSLAEEKCRQWNARSAAKQYINNIVYSPEYSSVGMEEKIELKRENKQPKYQISHYKSGDDLDLNIVD